MGRGKSKKDETSAHGEEEEGEDDQYEIQDARTPEKILGLPEDSNGYPIKVQRISCGSHHTAMLLEDGSVYGVGIASDEAVPILDPVELIPAGIIDRPVRQFEAHHDRTTVIDDQGTVFQTHLWKDETLREYSYFTPAYVDAMLDEGQAIQSIHRGWRHTIIVTKPIEA
jgi:alpha-tubulin suppressor-like RCC1 family protein